MSQQGEETRKSWEPMQMSYVGDVREVVQGGGGKSGTAADPGDVLKPPGSG